MYAKSVLAIIRADKHTEYTYDNILMKKIAKKKHEMTIEQTLLKELSRLIEKSQFQVVPQINSTLNMFFWHIGKRINENISSNKRANYGKQIIATLSRQLTEKYSRGFERKPCVEYCNLLTNSPMKKLSLHCHDN